MSRFPLSFDSSKEASLKGFKVIVLAATMLAAIPLFAAVDAFIWFEGIQGEATDPSHKGWIEAYSFSWGMTNPSMAAAHGNIAANGCESHEARFVAGGKGLPQMFQLCASGKLLPAVNVEIHGQRHTLENVMFASCQNTPVGDSVRGTFTLKFTRCATHATVAPVQRVSAASVLNPNSPSATTNGQLTLGNLPAENLNLLGVRSQGSDSVLIVHRGANSRLMLACANGKHYQT